jgi:Domain of unknown function DUF1828/Domain of unknown function DUF1829
MTRDECQQLVDAYVKWLRRGLSAESVGNACELTTPFLDRHNDHIQIYAVRRNGSIMLSDDGYILSDLRASGLELTTSKRKTVLDTALNGFGVQLDGNRLQIEASPRNLGQRIHALIQAMLVLNDMFVMAQPRVATFFWEDVRAFLDDHKVRYSPRVKLSGRTGYDHAIDFLIPRSPEAPERLVQAINAPNKNTIGSYLFVLGDTREARGQEAEAYAFLNDRDREVGGDVIEALDAYKVTPALWSRREDYVQRLAA